MLDHVLLYVNGSRQEVGGAAAFQSLSDFLRRELGLVGTKIVCSEGDCGSCSVLLGRPSVDGKRLEYRPIDACIQFLFQLDGTHVVTIEGLARGQVSPRFEADGFGTNGCLGEPATRGLSAVQQAMVDLHGSQCGFCTPGFVVAMTGLLEERETLDEACLRYGLTGNLCRCTGYMPIFEAGAEVDFERHQRLEELYASAPMLAEFAGRRGESVEVCADWGGERHLLASPHDLPAALRFLNDHPKATIIAGATDVGVRINKSASMPKTILDLNRVAELDGVEAVNGELVLGARANWTAIERMCAELLPEFYKIARVFGAPQIRHVGTIGGNIANASPIADSLPLLYVTEAVLELVSISGTREVNINDFYHGYRKFDLLPGELIGRVRVPLPGEDELLKLYKVSRRRDLDISTFTAAVRMRLDGDGIAEAAIALGGVGPTVIRARRTEAFLRGQPFNEETMWQAGDVAAGEIAPISDVRGAADYRYQLARNILLKFFHETRPAEVPA